MSHSTNKPRGTRTACGIHAEGRDDYMVIVGPRLHAEESKLQRRINHFCSPKGFLEHFALVLGRRRLRRKLRVRFAVPHAMFLSQRIVPGRPTEERRIAEAAPEQPLPTANFR